MYLSLLELDQGRRFLRYVDLLLWAARVVMEEDNGTKYAQLFENASMT